MHLRELELKKEENRQFKISFLRAMDSFFVAYFGIVFFNVLS
jgi:hypothetical protein